MMRWWFSCWLLGVGLGLWLGQHGGQSLDQITIFNWLVLLALIVGSAAILLLPWILGVRSSQATAEGDGQVTTHRRESEER